MKRLKIISVLTIAAIFSGVLIFNSCSKQEMNEQTDAQDEQVIISDKDIAVSNSIKNFKKKVEYIKENPHFKSGKSVSIDSVVWYLDAGVNFTHAFTFETFENFHTDSVFVVIPINNGEADMNDLSDAYYELVDKIRDDVYATVQEEDKDLYVSSTEIKEQTAGTLTIKTTATIGSKHIEPGTEVPFGDEDDWMYGDTRGQCETGNGYGEWDAAEKIEEATLTYRYLYIQDHGVLPNGNEWVAVYTLPEAFIPLDPANQYELLFKNPEPNYGEYLYLFEDNDPDPVTMCIEDDYMNFYYHGVHDVIYDIVPANWPTNGLTFVNCDIKGAHTGNWNVPDEIFHYFENIRYKTRLIMIKENDIPVPIGD